MWIGIRLLLLVVMTLLVGPSVAAKQYNITVGYLPCITGEERVMQDLGISGALSLAIEEINNSTELLPDVDLLLTWNDTKCDTALTTDLIKGMTSSGVVAFFGPEDQCYSESVIKSGNLPIISYICSDDQNSTSPNIVRLDPPATKATKSVISLLRYYKWNKFSILHEESWATVAYTLENQANELNMTVNHRRSPLACCNATTWYNLIQETRNNTRIYVFLGSTSSLIEMMTAMESLKLLETGEYMVINVDMSTDYPPMKTQNTSQNLVCTNTQAFKKHSQSLLAVVSSGPKNNYHNFSDEVQKYNSRKPFAGLPSQFSTMSINHPVPIYAAYLYDSVKLYANALHGLIEENIKEKNKTLTYETLMTIVTNGSRIVTQIIANTPYKSISGLTISLDEKGVSEGNFTVLALKPVNFNEEGINCTHSMIPVGHFEPNKEFLRYKMNPRLPIDWVGNVKPEDEPRCGFRNEKCEGSNSQLSSSSSRQFAHCFVYCIVYFLYYALL